MLARVSSQGLVSQAQLSFGEGSFGEGSFGEGPLALELEDGDDLFTFELSSEHFLGSDGAPFSMGPGTVSVALASAPLPEGSCARCPSLTSNPLLAHAGARCILPDFLVPEVYSIRDGELSAVAPDPARTRSVRASVVFDFAGECEAPLEGSTSSRGQEYVTCALEPAEAPDLFSAVTALPGGGIVGAAPNEITVLDGDELRKWPIPNGLVSRLAPLGESHVLVAIQPFGASTFVEGVDLDSGARTPVAAELDAVEGTWSSTAGWTALAGGANQFPAVVECERGPSCRPVDLRDAEGDCDFIRFGSTALSVTQLSATFLASVGPGPHFVLRDGAGRLTCGQWQSVSSTLEARQLSSVGPRLFACLTGPEGPMGVVVTSELSGSSLSEPTELFAVSDSCRGSFARVGSTTYYLSAAGQLHQLDADGAVRGTWQSVGAGREPWPELSEPATRLADRFGTWPVVVGGAGGLFARAGDSSPFVPLLAASEPVWESILALTQLPGGGCAALWSEGAYVVRPARGVSCGELEVTRLAAAWTGRPLLAFSTELGLATVTATQGVSQLVWLDERLRPLEAPIVLSGLAVAGAEVFPGRALLGFEDGRVAEVRRGSSTEYPATIEAEGAVSMSFQGITTSGGVAWLFGRETFARVTPTHEGFRVEPSWLSALDAEDEPGALKVELRVVSALATAPDEVTLTVNERRFRSLQMDTLDFQRVLTVRAENGRLGRASSPGFELVTRLNPAPSWIAGDGPLRSYAGGMTFLRRQGELTILTHEITAFADCGEFQLIGGPLGRLRAVLDR